MGAREVWGMGGSGREVAAREARPGGQPLTYSTLHLTWIRTGDSGCAHQFLCPPAEINDACLYARLHARRHVNV